MKTIRFLQRGEASKFFPELDAQGAPQFDLKSGKVRGEQRVIYFVEGDEKELPDSVANAILADSNAMVADGAPAMAEATG